MEEMGYNGTHCGIPRVLEHGFKGKTALSKAPSDEESHVMMPAKGSRLC